MSRVPVLLGTIKFSHSVFALPFCLLALFVAAGGLPSLRVGLLAVAAMVGARTAAMAFNRLVDRAIDARNPRTADRALPKGLVRPAEVAALLVAGALVFLGAAALLNRIALLFSVPVLAVLLAYSLTKRFTSASHFVLGLALGLSPLGAWVAVKGEAFLEGAVFPVLVGLSVLVWTASFDVIYACQDVEFDRREGLRSVPARLGVGRSLALSRALHVGAVLLLAAAGFAGGLSFIYYAGVAAVAGLLAYGHSIVREGDLGRLDVAFFTVNGWVSLSLMACTLLDLLVLGTPAGG